MKNKKLPIGIILIIILLVFTAIISPIAIFIEPFFGLIFTIFFIGITITLAIGLGYRYNAARIGTIVFYSISSLLAIINPLIGLDTFSLMIIFKLLLSGLIILYLTGHEVKKVFE
ncbi:hypothetical protein GOV12_07730 [Candidatus Pacearchaeota archaeon]|nr:hypothetical protein [Candidatus Pacearchaeota archaeon]